MKVAVFGARGRMGAEVVRAVEATDTAAEAARRADIAAATKNEESIANGGHLVEGPSLGLHRADHLDFVPGVGLGVEVEEVGERELVHADALPAAKNIDLVADDSLSVGNSRADSAPASCESLSTVHSRSPS